MGTVRKMGQEYFIEFEARGLKYQQKAGADEPAAWKLLSEIEEKIACGEVGIVVRDVLVPAFLEDFLSTAATRYPAQTMNRFKSTANHFQEFLETQFRHVEVLSQITPKIVEAYKAQLRKASRRNEFPPNPKVINLTLLLLREIFEHGIRLGFLNDNPGLHVDFLSDWRKELSLISVEDLQKILTLASAQLQRVAKIILATGLHPREICQLTVADVNYGAHEFRTGDPRSRGRNFMVRQLPLTPVVLELFGGASPAISANGFLLNEAPGKPLTWEVLDAEWRQCCRTAAFNGIPHLTGLRSHFVQQIVARGVSLVRVATILGYGDVAGVLKYIELIPDVHERFQKGF